MGFTLYGLAPSSMTGQCLDSLGFGLWQELWSCSRVHLNYPSNYGTTNDGDCVSAQEALILVDHLELIPETDPMFRRIGYVHFLEYVAFLKECGGFEIC
jgi:hypothetical protein